MNKQEIEISIDDVILKGILSIPTNPLALVIFAHGAGSSRLSPRNNYVAEVLNKAGLATLLFDLLTEKEDFEFENRFDIPLLTKRLIDVTKWIKDNEDLKDLNIGYFGSSTGSASAIIAATKILEDIKALVSRGGRPDLAKDYLSKLKSPTLLMVGGNDDVVIDLNEEVFNQLNCEKKLEIIPDATHLFEEPGALEKVAELAKDWFLMYLI